MSATSSSMYRSQACPTFPRALAAGDLDAALACFTDEACLITPDATTVRGRGQIRPLLSQLIARNTEIEVLLSNVLVSGQVALASERWVIRCDGIEGARYEQSSNPTLVLRWIGGDWRLEIAALWGWARPVP